MRVLPSAGSLVVGMGLLVGAGGVAAVVLWVLTSDRDPFHGGAFVLLGGLIFAGIGAIITLLGVLLLELSRRQAGVRSFFHPARRSAPAMAVATTIGVLIAWFGLRLSWLFEGLHQGQVVLGSVLGIAGFAWAASLAWRGVALRRRGE